MVILDYLEFSDLESDVEDVLELTHITPRSKFGRVKTVIPTRIRRALSQRKIVPSQKSASERSSSLPSLKPHKRTSKNFIKTITAKKKRARLISRIPKKCAKAWVLNYSFELDRFMKLTSDQHDAEFWNARLRMDLQRASWVKVTGIVEESFIFSQHEAMETRVDLVEVFLKFLKASIKEIISDSFSYLGEEGYDVLAKKAVLQGVIALCQDFINEPYFRFLKIACEDYGLTPLSKRESLAHSAPIIGSDGHIWKTDVSVKISQKEMIMEVKRTFSTVWVTDVEVVPAEYIFGFKRQYAIDLLGGPPQIYPPVWMGHVYGKTRELCCRPIKVKSKKNIKM